MCLGPKFIDYKEQGFFNICGKIPPFFRMCLPSQFCIIMNILKSLKLRSDGKRREFEKKNLKGNSAIALKVIRRPVSDH